MSTHNELTCVFGHHVYGRKVRKDGGLSIRMCKICQRSGRERLTGFDVFVDYDEKGNRAKEEWKKRSWVGRR